MKDLKFEKGYTLVEVLITIAVSAILFGAVFVLYSNILIIQNKTQRLEAATRSAHQQIESLRNLQYNNLVEGEDIDFSDTLPDILPAGSVGTVVVSDSDNDLKRVDVSVIYPEDGATQTVTVSSLIGIIGITQ